MAVTSTRTLSVMPSPSGHRTGPEQLPPHPTETVSSHWAHPSRSGPEATHARLGSTCAPCSQTAVLLAHPQDGGDVADRVAGRAFPAGRDLHAATAAATTG